MTLPSMIVQRALPVWSGRDDDVAVTGEVVAPEGVLMARAAVAVREDHQREPPWADRRVAMGFVPVELVHLGGTDLVRLADQLVDFGGHAAGDEVGVLVLGHLPGFVRRGVPDLRDERPRLLGEVVRPAGIDEHRGRHADRKGSRRQRVRRLRAGRLARHAHRREQCDYSSNRVIVRRCIVVSSKFRLLPLPPQRQALLRFS